MNSLNVLVLPISGGAFVSQMASIQHLTQINYRPDITLASSGGNIPAYIASAAQWKWAAMERLAREIKPEMFVKEWSQILLLSYLIGFFNGNIYAKGTGIKDFFMRAFMNMDITQDEIWTGTYNKDKKRSLLFCNRSKKNSILFPKDDEIDLSFKEITKSMDHVFCNGDIEKIAKACIASASIPGLVPGQTFDDGDVYVDGGVYSPSPLTILQNSIINYCKKAKKGLHIKYISPFNFDIKSKETNYNFIDTLLGAKDDILKSNMIIERTGAYNMFTSYIKSFNKNNNFANYSNFKCTYKNLCLVKKIIANTYASLLEIYPADNSFCINITNFTQNDIIENIHKNFENCFINFWWYKTKNIIDIDFDIRVVEI